MVLTLVYSVLALLAIYPHDRPLPNVDQDPCLATNYYGTYGNQSVFLPPSICYYREQIPEPSDVEAFDLPKTINEEDVQLVWIEKAAVEARLQPAGPTSFEDLISSWERPGNWMGEQYGNDQEALSLPQAPQRMHRLLHSTSHSALLALDKATAYGLSDLLPSYWRAYALPITPLAAPLPVPDVARERVATLLKHLHFDPRIAQLVNSISVPQMQNDVRWLTGEDSASGIVSRHSFSSGARVAADWLQKRFEQTGAVCEQRQFLPGFAPNVICRYPASVNTTATVLISAHYDSRGTFGSTRAPGGDDDGSGTTGLVAIARAIGRSGVKFRSNVELVAFAGEEQGLYGSNAYANELRNEDKNLTLMVQADMTAYRAPGEPAQIGLPETIGTPEVTQLAANISALYSPELTVGYTPACCSDHQSFHYRGFPATQVFERAGPIADPMYHNSGDLSEREGYDLEQAKSIAKVQFAMVLHAAGFDLPSDEDLE